MRSVPAATVETVGRLVCMKVILVTGLRACGLLHGGAVYLPRKDVPHPQSRDPIIECLGLVLQVGACPHRANYVFGLGQELSVKSVSIKDHFLSSLATPAAVHHGVTADASLDPLWRVVWVVCGLAARHGNMYHTNYW